MMPGVVVPLEFQDKNIELVFRAMSALAGFHKTEGRTSATTRNESFMRVQGLVVCVGLAA
jgi:hypothetical protein